MHVLAGRTGRWKGIFAHHTWVVVKPKGGRYTRYDVVGWGRPVRIDAYAPDGRWFGDTPQIVAVLKSEAARARHSQNPLTPSRAILSPRRQQRRLAGSELEYFCGSHRSRGARIGGGSVAHRDRQGLCGSGALRGDFTPSRTGFQITLRGLMGVSIGWVEGVELNMLGLVAGIDMRRPALKIPGWGRVGLPA